MRAPANCCQLQEFIFNFDSLFPKNTDSITCDKSFMSTRAQYVQKLLLLLLLSLNTILTTEALLLLLTTSMSGSNTHHGIDYIEFPVHDMAIAKEFYSKAFGWTIRDYGPGYAGIQRMDGSDDEMGGLALISDISQQQQQHASPLVVLYSSDIASSLTKVKASGGTITKDMFSFPGGQRFEFSDPSGNVLAVWTKG